jgi:hypothetical protein
MPVISPISHIVGRARIVQLLVARRLSWRQRQKARSHLNVLVTGNYSRSYRLLAMSQRCRCLQATEIERSSGIVQLATTPILPTVMFAIIALTYAVRAHPPFLLHFQRRDTRLKRNSRRLNSCSAHSTC